MKLTSTRFIGRSHQTQGFSLVELLVSIAIIAILAAVILPAVFVDADGAKEAVARRNAQEIANTASMAMSAGDSSVRSSANVEAALAKLMDGVTGQGGLSTTTFKISKLDPEEVQKAKQYLQFSNGILSLK